MVTLLKLFFPLIVLSSFSMESAAQDKWTLQKCIDVAIENNFQIKKLQLDSLETQLSYKAARSALYPSVSGGISYSLSPELSSNSSPEVSNASGKRVNQSSQYSLNAEWTVFDGMGLQTDIKMKELGIQKNGVSIKASQIDLVFSVTNAYLQILYSKEGLKNAEINRDASRVQKERTEALLSTGSASQVDLARMDASLAADEYTVVISENNFKKKERDLKKILQIPLDTIIEFFFPVIADSIQIQQIPLIDSIYSAALEYMPEVKNSQLSAQLAGLAIKKARAAFYPSISISSGFSTGNSNGSSSFQEQLTDNLNLRIGARLNIPIYDNLRKRTSLENAKLEEKRADLSIKEVHVALYEDVQNAYYDAFAAKSKFNAAIVQLDRARQSYQIAQEQFKLGMINPTELLVEKNLYLSAETELLQSKFAAVLTLQLIYILMGKSITL